MDIREERITQYVTYICEEGMPDDNLENLYNLGAEFVDSDDHIWTDFMRDGKPVGFICVSKPVEGVNKRAIHLLYVTPTMRNLGIGTTLLCEALQQDPNAMWCYAIPEENKNGRRFMTHYFLNNGYNTIKLASSQELPGSILYGWVPDPHRRSLLLHENEGDSNGK